MVTLKRESKVEIAGIKTSIKQISEEKQERSVGVGEKH